LIGAIAFVGLSILITGFFITDAIRSTTDAIDRHRDTVHDSVVELIVFFQEGEK
jgi:hypothetical protein